MKVCNVCKIEKDESEFGKNGKQWMCNQCLREYSRNYRLINKDALKKKRDANKDYTRWEHTRRKYGIGKEQYMKMYNEQEGHCLACGDFYEVTAKNKNDCLVIDHDHETGEIRGLLCHHCNLGISCFFDDIERLTKAIEYIKRIKGEK